MNKVYEYFPNLANDTNNSLIFYSGSQTGSEVNVLTLGHEKCESGKPAEGPKANAYYLIHLISSGKGDFSSGGKTYSLCAGDIFVTFPGVPYSYCQDPSDPWEYIWATFTGFKAADYFKRCRFSEDSPVYRSESRAVTEAFGDFVNVEKFTRSKDLKAFSCIMNVFAAVSEERESVEAVPGAVSYIETAKTFIDEHYTDESLDLKALSAHLGLNPNYFSRIFSDSLKIPFSRYLIILRIQKACKLIQESGLKLSVISKMVGYSDPLYFSRLFKKYVGYTPGDFRKYGKTAPDLLNQSNIE